MHPPGGLLGGDTDIHSGCPWLVTTPGATSPDGQVVVVRVLVPMVEPAMDLLKQVWKAWRGHFWKQAAPSPRIWSV